MNIALGFGIATGIVLFFVGVLILYFSTKLFNITESKFSTSFIVLAYIWIMNIILSVGGMFITVIRNNGFIYILFIFVINFLAFHFLFRHYYKTGFLKNILIYIFTSIIESIICVVLGLVLVVVVIGFGLGTLNGALSKTIRVVDYDTGRPIKGITANVSSEGLGIDYLPGDTKKYVTDSNGKFTYQMKYYKLNSILINDPSYYPFNYYNQVNSVSDVVKDNVIKLISRNNSLPLPIKRGKVLLSFNTNKKEIILSPGFVLNFEYNKNSCDSNKTPTLHVEDGGILYQGMPLSTFYATQDIKNKKDYLPDAPVKIGTYSLYSKKGGVAKILIHQRTVFDGCNLTPKRYNTEYAIYYVVGGNEGSLKSSYNIEVPNNESSSPKELEQIY